MASVIRRIINSAKAPPPIGPYSQAVQVNATLYISGQIGMDTDCKLVEGIEAQTRLTIENMGHILKEAGGSYNNVVKTTVYLSDFANFQAVNKIYAEYFTQNFPARACFQVAALPKNALIEIEAVAAIGTINDSKI